MREYLRPLFQQMLSLHPLPTAAVVDLETVGTHVCHHFSGAVQEAFDETTATAASELVRLACHRIQRRRVRSKNHGRRICTSYICRKGLDPRHYELFVTATAFGSILPRRCIRTQEFGNSKQSGVCGKPANNLQPIPGRPRFRSSFSWVRVDFEPQSCMLKDHNTVTMLLGTNGFIGLSRGIEEGHTRTTTLIMCTAPHLHARVCLSYRDQILTLIIDFDFEYDGLHAQN